MKEATTMKHYFLALSLIFLAASTTANDKPYQQYGDTRVYFSAFNSSFITPEVATAYNITRGKDRGLVNISVIEGQRPQGKTANVSGTVSNILGQQQTLEFFEVREGDAVYYLAPFRFEDEDFMTFTIETQLEPRQPARSFKFQRTFYHDQ